MLQTPWDNNFIKELKIMPLHITRVFMSRKFQLPFQESCTINKAVHIRFDFIRAIKFAYAQLNVYHTAKKA